MIGGGNRSNSGDELTKRYDFRLTFSDYMFVGKVYKIMIGSPSDIEEEVSIAKKIILQWSCLNAETHNIVVLPLHWKENSYPGCGNHPQKMLDNQLVNNSDMLVCIFGSRIGTPTDTSESGSIEEIEEHIKAGKQVMNFFGST